VNRDDQPEHTGHRGRGRPPVRGSALDARRASVLTAAARLVGDMDSRYLSVEQLIQAAGTSRPTFYRWFPGGLPQVMELLIAEANADLLNRIMIVIRLNLPLEERVTLGIARYFDWARGTGPLAKAIYREAFDSASPACRYRRQTLTSVKQLFLQEAKRIGLMHVTPLMVETLIGWIESAMFTLMQYYPVSEQQAAEQARLTATMVLGMVGEMKKAG
jgi:TetR/AcrR family transcriptional regulator